MSEPLDTQVVSAALDMALGRRRPAAGLLHHSARGAPDASHASRGRLADHGMAGRRRGTGDGLDKAVAARLVGRRKRERPSQRYDLTRQAVRDDIMDSIAMCSNRWRKHASLGDVSPNAYEKIAPAASFCVRFSLTTTLLAERTAEEE
jgi:putative transposase